MSLNVAISKSTAVSELERIRTDAETFLVDMDEAYTALKDSMVNSQGDYIEALKTQLDSEKELLDESVHFFKMLLVMMKRAEADFETVDKTYADRKILKPS